MRIALINIGQETNDFNPQPTTLTDYRSFGLYEGQEMLEKMRGLGEVGGYIEAIEQSGLDVETIPIIRGWASAAGRLDDATRRFFEERIRTGLARAGKIDGLAIQLHGACAADGIDDVEGSAAGALPRDPRARSADRPGTRSSRQRHPADGRERRRHRRPPHPAAPTLRDRQDRSPDPAAHGAG